MHPAGTQVCSSSDQDLPAARAGESCTGQLRQLVQNGGLIQCVDSSSTGVRERPSGDTEQCFNGSSTGLPGGGDETGHHIASWADHWERGGTLSPTPPHWGELRSQAMPQLVSEDNRVSCQWRIRLGALHSSRFAVVGYLVFLWRSWYSLVASPAASWQAWTPGTHCGCPNAHAQRGRVREVE